MLYLREFPQHYFNVHSKCMNFCKQIIFAVFISLLSATTYAGVEDFGNSLDVTLYNLAAESNDPSAQYLIARKYLRGKSVTRNIAEAIRWFKAAEKQGHAKAQFQLGVMYLRGVGVQEDKVVAKNYLLRAANNGLDDAQFELGQYYLKGHGGAQNTHKAVKWFEKSIAQDNILAQSVLGKMYLNGKGVKKNVAKAIRLLSVAAKAGDFQAAKMVAKYGREHPDEVLRIAKAAKKNKPKKPKSKKPKPKKSKPSKENKKLAADNSAEIMLQEGMNYLSGDHGFEKDADQGVELLRRAAEKGHAVAQYDYGVVFYQGIYVDTDLARSVRWLSKAVKGGVLRAKPLLDEVQLKLALSDKIKYASKPEEQYKIGNQFLHGNTVEKDVAEAFQWYLKAARQQHLKSQYQVGEMYQAGLGIEKNTKKAKYWLVKASDRGVVEADDLLIKMEAEQNGVAVATQRTNGKDREATEENEDIIEASSDETNEVAKFDSRDKQLKKKSTGDSNNHTVAMTSTRIRQNDSMPAQNSDELSASTQMKALISKARQGENESQFLVAKNYLSGEGVKKDVTTGVEWLTLSANNKHIRAQLQLGSMFLDGKYVDKNYSEAFRLINLAATQGSPQAQLVLGDIYKNGLGVKKSNSKAIKWYRKSANHGNEEARRRLGGCRVC